MIFHFLFPMVTSLFDLAFGFLPIVTELPLSIDATLASAIGYVYAFMDVFWPLQPIVTCLLLYYPIKVSLMILRVVIGSRAPDAS